MIECGLFCIIINYFIFSKSINLYFFFYFIKETMNESMIKLIQYSQKILIIIICSSIVISFIYLNHVQPYYFIDEVFHVSQTLQYCNNNFTQVCFDYFLFFVR